MTDKPMPDAKPDSPNSPNNPFQAFLKRKKGKEGAAEGDEGKSPPGDAAASGGPPGDATPESIKSAMDEVDRIADEGEEAEEEIKPGDMPPGGAAPPGDMQPLADALGVDVTKASALYDAAQSIPRTAGIQPKELGDLLVRETSLRMELEARIGEASEPKGEQPIRTLK